MNLETALKELAAFYNLDAAKLIEYAAEDAIGGYHSDPDQANWPLGSIWGVEGQVLYALTRALRPEIVLEVGTAFGCSAAHISAALVKNRGKSQLICVDHQNRLEADRFTAAQLKRIKRIEADATIYIQTADTNGVGLVFDDAYHDHEGEAAFWTVAAQRVKPGTFILSHDVAHDSVGTPTSAGIIEAVGTDWLKLRIEPADCGLGVWRK